MRNIKLSRESTMTQRKAIIETMKIINWKYMGTFYNVGNNIIKMSFKEPINKIENETR